MGKKLLFIGLLGVLLLSPSAWGLEVAQIFSNNMVLQRDIQVPVWGLAKPNENVSVKFMNQKKSTVADGVGKWMVRLDPLKASAQAEKLIVTGKDERKEFTNILVGEVWLCSGQSNMRSHFVGLKIMDEIKNVNYPLIRMESDGQEWGPCTVKDWRLKYFSCVGYYFGLKLWQELQVPIGLINISRGMSSIETWMTPDSIESNDSLIDQNGCKLSDEMKKFKEFHSNYERCSPKEKERVFLAHCTSKYGFARSYLGTDRKPKIDKYKDILYHMTVIKPACLFNSLIAPVVPFGIRGVVWYQGETNIIDTQYTLKQQLLAEGWRKQWDEGDFPFYITQIAPCNGYPILPQFWIQQYKAAKAIKNSGIACTVDIGDPEDYHPKNKRDVGLRLALLALRDTYGRKGIVASGPTFKAMRIEGKRIIVEFDNLGSGLTTRDGKSPDWFEISGEDKKFHPAQAKIKGTKVECFSTENELGRPYVIKPRYIRYAWSNKAEPNLRNKEGLPAFPFTTEDR
jgi:sialate O-acetylesterase